MSSFGKVGEITPFYASGFFLVTYACPNIYNWLKVEPIEMKVGHNVLSLILTFEQFRL